MRRTPRIIAILLVTILFIYLLGRVYPPIRHLPSYLRLLSMDAPTHLPVPVEGVARRSLSDTWGAARSGGRRHEGIDIFASRNRPIRSVSEGLVEKVGWDALGGRVVVVTGPGGYHHYYAHLEKFGHLEAGDWIDSGTVVGYVGNSGNAAKTPTHLHYGIYRPAGGAVNPYPFLAARKSDTPRPGAPRSGAPRSRAPR